MKRVATVLALVSTMLIAAGCGDGEEPSLPAQDVRIATGLPGGVYNPYGQALAGVINRHASPLRASARSTEGSVANLQLLDEREAEVAFSLADSTSPALRGEPPFRRPVRLAALARLYDDYVQVIARRDSGLRDVAELARKRVSIGAPSSGTALTARRILKLADLRLRGKRAPRVRQLGLGDSVKALARRQIDAFFWSGGLPTEAIEGLQRSVPIRLLALPPGIAAALDPNLFTETDIPRGTYDSPTAVNTVAAANLLVVRRDLPEPVAFRLTGLLFKHRGELEEAHPEARRLNQRKAIATYPVDLHPGAERWYREERR